MVMCVEPYSHRHRLIWDEFVRASTNGTFLFDRNYMEYHSHRFQDASLLVFEDGRRLLALLPANRVGDEVVSHQGLSYGGFVFGRTATLPRMMRIFDATLNYLSHQGVRRVTYKSIPYIYHRTPSEEASYALTWFAARLVKRELLSVIVPSQGLSFQERRRRSIKKATRAGLSVTLTNTFEIFWPIMERNLAEVYGVRPVHTLQEIRLLHDRFPDNIKLFSASNDGAMLAGVVIYESNMVAHVQYVGTSLEGRRLGAVDLIYDWLLSSYYASKPFFDFGNSLGLGDWGQNLGVLEFKESFGARAVIQDFFELDVAPEGVATSVHISH